MRARWTTMLVIAGALTLPASAVAGGWATVELSSTPDGLSPGQPWVVDLTILQHGRTPLEGVSPKVVISQAGGGEERSVAAEPTAAPGVYRARVTFPDTGRWRYAVDDGFTQVHTYPPIRIRDARPEPASAAGDDGGSGSTLWLGLLAALGAGLLAGGVTSYLRSRTSRARSAAAET